MRSIDIHAHITPQCFWRATEGGGDWHTLRREQDARGQQYAVVGGHRGQLPPRARWTPEERLADMDSLGVDIHVLSPYSGFYNYELDTATAMATSKDANDEISQMTKGPSQATTQHLSAAVLLRLHRLHGVGPALSHRHRRRGSGGLRHRLALRYGVRLAGLLDTEPREPDPRRKRGHPLEEPGAAVGPVAG
jgi:hypothetical protein